LREHINHAQAIDDYSYYVASMALPGFCKRPQRLPVKPVEVSPRDK
jgi:hypothetical protein